MRILVCIFCSLLVSFNLLAQELKYGARAGVNVSGILGATETDDAGNEIEVNKFIGGFHIGPTLDIKFANKSSFSVQLAYSQKGGKNRFDDTASYYFLLAPVQDSLFSRSAYVQGAKKQNITTNLGYLDLSAMYYYNVFSNIKVGVGATVGFLLNASGVGNTDFSGSFTESGIERRLDLITINNDYSYISDTAFPDPFGTETGILTNEVFTDGNALLDKLYAPREVGAYYDFTEKQGSFYKRFDIGVNLELRWELESGLYFGVRGNVGLLDVTNNYYDISRHKVDDNLQRISRADFDRNVSIQTSVGFNF